MTLPTIFPAEYQGTINDFLQAKADRSGAARIYSDSVSVPTGTVTTTIVGLFPFNRGLRLNPNALDVISAALGTSVTGSLGVVYNDTVNNTSNQTLFTNASTSPAAGGSLAITQSATTLGYVTTGDGWLAFTVGGATTGSTGAVTVNAIGSYDGLGADNSNSQN